MFFVHNFVPSLKTQYGSVHVLTFAAEGAILGPYSSWSFENDAGYQTRLEGFELQSKPIHFDNP
jgi:hypothetical protein